MRIRNVENGPNLYEWSCWDQIVQDLIIKDRLCQDQLAGLNCWDQIVRTELSELNCSEPNRPGPNCGTKLSGPNCPGPNCPRPNCWDPIFVTNLSGLELSPHHLKGRKKCTLVCRYYIEKRCDSRLHLTVLTKTTPFCTHIFKKGVHKNV